MKILKNETIDYLTANFVEDETLWLISSVFDYADEVRFGHFIYKYAGESGTNTINNPQADSLLFSPTWVEIAPTNYYSMLDGRTNTQTENADTIIIEIQSINYDSISLLGIEAISVKIELIETATSIIQYTKEFNLNDTTSFIDAFTYYFSEFELSPSIYEDMIPLYNDAKLRITIDNTGGIAKCGRLVFGRSYYVGDTKYGGKLTQESYSRKEVDEFGNETLVQLGSVNLDSYEVQIPTAKIPSLRRKGADLDAIAILFIMDESADSKLENLLNFGYWYDFSMVLSNPVKSKISLTIKGIL